MSVPAGFAVEPGRFAIRDLGLAEAGRRQIGLAEKEMPGLMALREEFAPSQPLAGARISGSLHMTTQTAVLIETLVALGARVRWASCNIFSTQDDAAAAVAARGGPAVFAWKGETLEAYWWCTLQALSWPEGGPDLVVDDGADATSLLLAGAQFEQRGPGAEAFQALGESAEGRVTQGLIAQVAASRAGGWARLGAAVRGASEETTTGVHRLARWAEAGQLPFPVIDVNDSVTKSKFDNVYGIRHSLPDGLNRATDILIGG
ncbi:MAG: adenosylhomocysteinase, partial [Bifidobacteriaceae bacterium]|nr:adenosylhomocysteinase [Bifidobacteriaceae bacterium]